MKVTIELPDALHLEAKKRALEQRRPLRALVEEALREALARKPAPARRKKICWTTAPGGLPPGLDVSSREKMYAWIEKDRTRK